MCINKKYPEIINERFLNENLDCIFVFGDNTKRVGCGGAAFLRHHPHAYGFVTKKRPDNCDSSYYTKEEYAPILVAEIAKLKEIANARKDKVFLVSKVGAGLANKYNIWDIIEPALIAELSEIPNIVLLWRQGI